MSGAIDQKAYLQRYLSGPSKDKKKKKKKEKKLIKGKGFKIIDDDLDLSKLRALETDELDIYGEGDEAPQVAGIIDDRPEELKKLEQFKTSKWKVVNQDDGFNSKIEIEEIKQSAKEVEKENEIIFGKMYSDSEDEQERDTKNSKDQNDSDASPPRKTVSKGQTDSPQRKSRKYSDANPQRKESSRKNNDESDASPPRKKTNIRIGDSPQRKSRKDDDSWQNSSRKENLNKSQKQEDSDASPPRKTTKQQNNSPSRKNRKQDDRQRKDISKRYDSDESPPRKSAKQTDRYEFSRKSDKPRESKKNYDSDLSPPRKRDRSRETDRKGDRLTENDRKRDRSPRKERKQDRTKKPSRWGDFEFEKNEVEMISREQEKKSKNGRESSNSPKRDSKRRENRNTERDKLENKKRNDSDSDLSPPRINRTKERRLSDSDQSPPRKSDRNRITERDRGSDSPPPTNKKMAKTLEGKMAGLQNAKQLRHENESFRRREDEVFKRMGDDVSGRNAKAVSRKAKRETSEDRNKQREKADRQKEIDEKYKKWSKGLKQIEDQQERMQDYFHEASKPLARHKDDRDLEARLKDVERAGDPMLQYIREKRRDTGDLPPERPSYKGSYPPNRFNIRPGYRWDGVDRSNGYEKKYFDQQSKKKAQEEEAYKWSTEDL